MAKGMVSCCECHVLWPADHRGVLYRSADNRWWCANWRACRDRLRLLYDRGAAL